MRRLVGTRGADWPMDTALPVLRHPRDPFAGDERLPLPAGAAVLRRCYEGPADDAQLLAWDAAFEDGFARWLDGGAPGDAFAAAVEGLGIGGPVRHDRRPPRVSPLALPDTALSDVAEDWLPDVGLFGPERVLGPWAACAAARRVRVAVGAVLAFSPIVPPSLRPIGRLVKNEPRPSVEVRGAVVAIHLAPPMLWSVGAAGRLHPLLPLARRFRPADAAVARVPDAPAVLGRAVPGPDGWFLAAALPLPAVPDPTPISRRVRAELLRLRRHDRRITWEDLLRDRGELLYRCTCESFGPALHGAAADAFARWDAAAGADAGGVPG